MSATNNISPLNLNPSENIGQTNSPSKDSSRSSETNYERIWNSAREKIEGNGRWVITEELNGKVGYEELFEKTATGNRLFKGTFLLHNFPEKFPKGIDFLMTDREVPVGQIKKEVERIAGISKEKLIVSFMGFNPLADHVDLYYGLNCHGRGGEQFHLLLTGKPKSELSKPLEAPTPSKSPKPPFSPKKMSPYSNEFFSKQTVQ